ncbi:hypothetical protein [Acanthopleuribacter pedis]|uniref:Uncharacterized protein n=1 Tax=Acanthopleuribacter pedis TaxID=442870 RepID=A0A8J7Q7P8_9BACT|nr:hypothetical protein [Acanthopleuribacter pedis]MBO1319906.1 hypothetical protein [Acanthopleuribacter pedis]
MKKPIGLVFNGVWSQHLFAEASEFKKAYELVYIHDLADIDLSGYQAVVVPFQSNGAAMHAHREQFLTYLAKGGFLALFGDHADGFLPDTQWEERHVDNTWWKNRPDQPPITWTDESHPLYGELAPRHRGWHHHGVYTQIPPGARVVQKSRADEIVTWQTDQFGGLVFASTKDPIVEHGIRQIRHLHHYVQAFTNWAWAGGEMPAHV